MYLVLRGKPKKTTPWDLGMDFSAPCSLSPSGGLVLLPDEIVRKMQASIDVYIGAVKSDAHRHGIATVTTHRLVWVRPDGRSGYQWSLAQVRPP